MAKKGFRSGCWNLVSKPGLSRKNAMAQSTLLTMKNGEIACVIARFITLER
jgi:hypothetical protein